MILVDFVTNEMTAHLTGLLGKGIGLSPSPLLHNRAFAHLGMADWKYQLIDIPPDELREFVRSAHSLGFVGFNVTVPYKERVVTLLSGLEEQAKRIGAVNTVVVREGTLRGTNTDWIGFKRAVAEASPEPWEAAVVLGTGGTARAMVFALLEMEVERIVVIGRNQEHAARLVSELGGAEKLTSVPIKEVKKLGLLGKTIVCSSVTPEGEQWASETLAKLKLAPDSLGFDAVYSPSFTPFLRKMRETGGRTVSGLRMLLYQAAESFQIWTKRRAPIKVMEDALKEVTVEH